jgi:beta-glucanase (GH16 family)
MRAAHNNAAYGSCNTNKSFREFILKRLAHSSACIATMLLAACQQGDNHTNVASSLSETHVAPPTVTLDSLTLGIAPDGQDAAAYQLSFSEEFDSGFHSTVWNDHLWYEASNTTKNYAVQNSSLQIWPQKDSTGKFFNRTIDTDGHFSQAYGYFEIEARLPKGKGTWPTFWLMSHSTAARPEIDVMKAFPGVSGWGTPDSSGVLHPTAYGMTSWTDSNVQAGSKKLATADLSANYHKYGLKWESGKQTYYFDGQPVYSINVSMSTPMFMLVSLWFGGASGTPDASTPTGSGNSFDIRYVRAWKFKTSTTPAAPATAAVDYYGDSTIWGYKSGVGGQVANPAPAVFAATLPNYSLPTQYTVRNEGVSGTTACQLLNGTDGKHPAWDTQLSNTSASIVIVNHAINDEWKDGSIDNYKSCLTSLAQKAKAHGKIIIFETPNPTRDSYPNGLDAWTDAMRTVASQQGAQIIDQYAYLKAYLNGASVSTICPDGLHPTDAVYTMKGQYAAKVFSTLRRQ